jgi:hypothetical protein
MLGSLVEFVVQEVHEDSRTVQLKLHAGKSVEKANKRSSLSFLAIFPGMMFNVVIEEKLEVCRLKLRMRAHSLSCICTCHVERIDC